MPLAVIPRLLILLSLLGTVSAIADEPPKPADSPAPTDAPADHQGSRRLISQGDSVSIVLEAKDASVHGQLLRYEPAPNKNTLGYWTNMDDWASWDFEVKKPLSYAVEVLQGCGTGSGNADVEVSVDKQVLKFKVQDTGGFQAFVPRIIGSFNLTEGRHTLAVHAKTKPGFAVMDLRQVTLTPDVPLKAAGAAAPKP